MSARLATMAALLLAAAGCFDPSFDSGKLRCSADGRCPPGYGCHSGVCYKNGSGPVADASAAVDEGPSGGDDGGNPIDGGGDGGGSDDAGTIVVVPQPVGQPCSGTAQCVTGFCADGVCCDQACSGSCSACNLTGSVGTCSFVTRGDPSPAGHSACVTEAKSSCGHDGTCDGAGSCALWSSGTLCASGSCDSGTNVVQPDSTCDGAGSCVTPTPIGCAPYLCSGDGKTCFTTCASVSDCSSGNVCTNSSCGLKTQGSSCSSDTECGTGHCADGVCCDQACGGTCQACNLSGTLGTCKAVVGQPAAGHGACGGFGTTCGSTCNGTNQTACTYTGAGTGCNDGNACTYGDVCNGSGTCAGTAISCSSGSKCVIESCNGTSTCSVSYPSGNICGTCRCGDLECDGAGNCSVQDGCRASGECP